MEISYRKRCDNLVHYRRKALKSTYAKPMKSNIYNICRGFFIHSLLLVIFMSLFPKQVSAQVKPATANPYYERPAIVPIPNQVAEIKQPSVSLNGTWLSKRDTLETFIKNPDDMTGWTEVIVPQAKVTLSLIHI